jgi:hypothetical protein
MKWCAMQNIPSERFIAALSLIFAGITLLMHTLPLIFLQPSASTSVEPFPDPVMSLFPLAVRL